MDLATLVRFREDLESIRVRLAAGETLTQILHRLPPVRCDGDTFATWALLRDRILSGQVQGGVCLDSYVRQIKIRIYADRLCRRALENPRMQAVTILGLGAVFAGSAYFLFPEILRPQPGVVFLSLGLHAAGYGLLRFWLRRYRRHLELVRWLHLLADWRAHLSSGRTSVQFLSEALADGRRFKDFPTALRNDLRTLSHDLNSGFALAEGKLAVVSRGVSHSALERHARTQIACLRDLLRGGMPLTGALSEWETSFQELLESETESRSERLKYLSLVPLFCAHLPGFAVLLIAPLTEALLPASPH